MTYHSVRMNEEWLDWLESQIQQSHPGDVITLPVRPEAINVEVDTPSDVSEDALSGLSAASLTAATAGGNTLIPIVQSVEDWPSGGDDKKSRKSVPVYPGEGFGPSRVQVRSVFPLQPSLAVTVHTRARAPRLTRQSQPCPTLP